MQVIAAVMALAGLLGVSACGGKEQVPDRAFTKGERLACEEVAWGIGALGMLGSGLRAPAAPAGENPDVGLLRTLTDLRTKAQTIAAIPDSPLRAALEKYVEPALRLGAAPVSSDDRDQMGTALSEARETCGRIAPELYSRPSRVEFPKVPCPGGPQAVTVTTGEEPFAFANLHTEYDVEASLDWGDLTGDASEELVASLRCGYEDTGEGAVQSVQVVSFPKGADVENPVFLGIPTPDVRGDAAQPLGQALSARRGAVQNGLLEVAVPGKGKQAKEKLQTYRLANGRWQRTP